MKKRLFAPALFFFLILLTVGCLRSKASYKETKKPYVPVSQELFDALAAMDSILFSAVNTGDYETLKNLFTEDLEFFHDKAGLSHYAENMASLKDLIDNNRKVRRELVEGSLEVYPVPDYGAIQIGAHRFYNTEPGQKEQLGGTFKFVHIWKKEDGAWKIARVVSYDH